MLSCPLVLHREHGGSSFQHSTDLCSPPHNCCVGTSTNFQSIEQSVATALENPVHAADYPLSFVYDPISPPYGSVCGVGLKLSHEYARKTHSCNYVSAK